MTSGQPSPGVTWWRGHEMVDSTYERTYSEAVQNSLKWVSCIASQYINYIITSCYQAGPGGAGRAGRGVELRRDQQQRDGARV